MKNPYMTEENTVISFSGGRTSGYMLYKTLEAYGFKLPDNYKVIFCNTGKEMPETLDFIQKCSDEWGVDIHWLERWGYKAKKGSKHKYRYETRRTDYKNACRNGEPFEQMIKTFGILPNPVNRYCSAHLKSKAVRDYITETTDWQPGYLAFIGIRKDEDRRARKMMGTIDDRQERYCPLWEDNVTVEDVYRFWEKQPFDLNLYNNNGVTDWGNCDLCFLKAANKKMSIATHRPDLLEWWIRMENEVSETASGTGQFFRLDHPTYASMKIIATDQGSLDFGVNDETIPCFCGD